MKRKNTQNIGEIIQELISSNRRMSQGLLETQIIQNWPKILGPSVERHTRKIYLSNGVLFVQLDSSVVRNELMVLKEKIIKSLNNSVSSDIVKELVLR